MNTQNIGKKIALLRQEQSLTQQQLAAMLNVTHQAVSKWESGQSLPDMGTLLALTRIFGVTVEELTEEETPPAEENSYASEAAEREMNNDNAKEGEKMNIAQLIRMAPFMSREAVGEIAMNIETRLTALQLARLAPFVHQECLEALMEKHTPELTWDTLRRLAPFLRKEYVDRIAREIAGGSRTVNNSTDDFSRTMDEIGKAFDGIGKDMGKAFDELGRGVENTVRRAIRFGGRVVNEMSNVINDFAENVDNAAYDKNRSERGAAIRRKAFERALADGNWEWLGKHIEEIRSDEELMAQIAEKAKEEGQHDWICRNMGGYADAESIAAAIEGGSWDWLGDNAWQFSEEIQQKIALAAMKAENWPWLEAYSDQLKLGDTAAEIAKKAMEAGELELAESVASMHLSQTEKNDLLKAAYDAENTKAIEALIDLADEDFRKWMLLDLAEKRDWARVEHFAADAAQETLEELSEKAVEQGNFDAIDMLDRFL